MRAGDHVSRNELNKDIYSRTPLVVVVPQCPILYSKIILGNWTSAIFTCERSSALSFSLVRSTAHTISVIAHGRIGPGRLCGVYRACSALVCVSYRHFAIITISYSSITPRSQTPVLMCRYSPCCHASLGAMSRFHEGSVALESSSVVHFCV